MRTPGEKCARGKRVKRFASHGGVTKATKKNKKLNCEETVAPAKLVTIYPKNNKMDY